MPFRTPNILPGAKLPKPVAEESEEISERVPQYVHKAAKVPPALKAAVEAAGLSYKPELPDSLRRAVDKSGHDGRADRLMRRTVGQLAAKGVNFGSGDYDDDEEDYDYDAAEDEEEEKTEKKLVTRPFEDSVLRKAFVEFDLNGNEFIEAGELRHIFAQQGLMPTDNEISAMIHLCDRFGNGTVNYDDFLAIFSDPAASLAGADVKGIKRLLPRATISFDIRDALGMQVEEHTRLREKHLLVEDVRRDQQAWREGVKKGWRVIFLDGEPVNDSKNVFEAGMQKLADAIDPEKIAEKAAELKRKGLKVPQKAPMKYEYSITFAVQPGDVPEQEEVEEESEESEDDDDGENSDEN